MINSQNEVRTLRIINNLIARLSRWVALPLLLASVLAWGTAPDVFGGKDVSKLPLPSNEKVKATNADIQEIKDRLKEFESRERQDYVLILEGQRKTMDWWFSYLAVLTAIMAIFGALIPFLMGRKDKELIEQEKIAIEQDQTQIQKLLEEVKGMKEVAQDHLDKIRRDSVETESILRDVRSGTSSATGTKINEAVARVIDDKTADPLLRLRAEAISASQAKNANKAYALWSALTELAPQDASAQFNAGYWAQELAENTNSEDKLRWLKLAGKYYAQTLNYEPHMHEAAYNWGNVLADEAEILADSDLDAACEVWKQAGEKYQLALTSKLGDAATAENWGVALTAEARRIAVNDAERSKKLLDQAERLILPHTKTVPEDVAYNLACVYAVRGEAQACINWLQVCQDHEILPDCDYLRKDKDLDLVRDAPEFIEWLKSVCP